MIIIPSITIRKINLKFKKPSHAQIILNILEIECVLWESEVKIKYIKESTPAEAPFFFCLNIYKKAH